MTYLVDANTAGSLIGGGLGKLLNGAFTGVGIVPSGAVGVAALDYNFGAANDAPDNWPGW